MSCILIAYIATEKEIDASFINKTFNLELEPYGDTCSVGDNVVVPYLFYKGDLSIGCEKERGIFCYAIENGQNMFAREKYAYFDMKNNLRLSRNGETLRFGSPSDENELTQEEYDESMKKDPPPKDELKSLFDYILSRNKCFYIFFYRHDVEYKIKDHLRHLEKILVSKTISEYTSESAQESLIKHFAEKQTHDDIGIAYKVTRQ